MKYWQQILIDNGLTGLKALIFKNTYRAWLDLEIVRIYRRVPRIKTPVLDENLKPTGRYYLTGDALAFTGDLYGLPNLTDTIK